MANRVFSSIDSLWLLTILGCSSWLPGCGREEQILPDRPPRPVLVSKLVRRLPPSSSLISASVGSWKTEEIGFEVGGRVEFVVEPRTQVDGRIHDKEGNLLFKGTPIGRLESERFELQVARAKAEVTRAEQNLIAGETELNEKFPAQIAAATASRDLAQTEYARTKLLLDRNAGSQSDVDRDKANYKSAEAELLQLEAAEKAKAAEIEALKNEVLQAKQNLRDAERDLEDCTLHSSYGGQIAAISVVPGSVVSAGQPVATLQMMDPIKVELEVSAEDSRQLQQRERLSVFVNMPDDSQSMHDGYLYLIDPVADPLTRTFTVTLLVLNEELVDTQQDDRIATTHDIWRLSYPFLPAPKEDMLYVEENALLEDDEGSYLWMITNMTIGDDHHATDPKLKVRKLRVTPGSLKIPFLGNWVFQEVVVNDQEFDANKNLVVGELNVKDGKANQWNGDTVVRVSEGQWMLRPGDLVRVDLSGDEKTEGYYVPMEAITRQTGQSFIFIVESSGKESQVRKIPVKLIGPAATGAISSLRRIEAVQPGSLDDVTFVVEGAHYLIDGESVRTIESTGASQ